MLLSGYTFFWPTYEVWFQNLCFNRLILFVASRNQWDGAMVQSNSQESHIGESFYCYLFGTSQYLTSNIFLGFTVISLRIFNWMEFLYVMFYAALESGLFKCSLLNCDLCNLLFFVYSHKWPILTPNTWLYTWFYLKHTHYCSLS